LRPQYRAFVVLRLYEPGAKNHIIINTNLYSYDKN
jgi:hypothetical protein